VKRLWLERKLEGHDGCVNTVHFSPDGQLLVSGSDDLQIMFW
jgi:WD40 repeat protein